MGMADKVVLYSCLCFFREFGEVGAAKPGVVRLSEEASAASRRLCVETISSCTRRSSARSAASRRLCVETASSGNQARSARSAASRRLCVETIKPHRKHQYTPQPPLGGCVLKHSGFSLPEIQLRQPPLGGCVLKLCRMPSRLILLRQPPLGGYVLKRRGRHPFPARVG